MDRKSSSFIDELEETLIALILGIMTLLTFANVIARYIFNSNILWALEATVFLFAWLVLLGVSYGVKKNFHIGVDVIVGALPHPLKKFFSLLAVGACILFSVLMLKGACDYWLPFIGRRAFLEVDDIPMLPFLQFFAHWLNDGELYEKMPRFIPYAVLPIGMALLTFRFLEAGWRILTNQQDLIIAGHEAEEMLEEVSALQPPHHGKKED